MLRNWAFALFVLLAMLSCGEPDYQEDWLGKWYEETK